LIRNWEAPIAIGAYRDRDSSKFTSALESESDRQKYSVTPNIILSVKSVNLQASKLIL